jgi:hypothetical protein
LGMILAVACGSPGASVTPASPPTSVAPVSTSLLELPTALLPGYVEHASELDAQTISVDALDPSTLFTVLSGAGFQAGAERRYTARGRELTEVDARVLRFSSPAGAGSYVTWVGAHGSDLLGSQTTPAGVPDLPAAVAFWHEPCGACAKDTFQYFVAWTHDSYAITLRVGGPAAGLRRAGPLAQALDARVTKES